MSEVIAGNTPSALIPDRPNGTQSTPGCIRMRNLGPGEQEAELLQRLVEIIVGEAHPEAIILFGSRARGDAGPDSDVDLLVIEREPFSRAHSRIGEANRLYMAIRHVPVATDLLLYSRDEIDHWKGSLNHVIGRAWREGRVLHGRL